MTKIYKTILGLSLLLFGEKSIAQVAPYAFTQTSGVYNAITGGTVYGTSTTDDDVFIDPANPVGDPSGSQGVGLPIGFNFTYNGTTYDVFGIDNNGWMSFGQSSSSPGVDMDVSFYAQMISSTSAASPILQNRFAGFNRDLQAQTGSAVRVQNLGVSPNQTLVVQFENYREYAATGDNINFQMRIMQTSNIIEVAYGSCTFANTSSAQVGLRGTTNTDFNNRNVPTTGSWAASVAGLANTDAANFSPTLFPSSGQIYRWTPPPLCTGAPSAGSVTSSFSICPNTQGVVTNVSSNLFTGIVYQWMQAPAAAGPWTNVTTGSGFNTQILTTASLTTLTFYKLVITCTASAQSATTAVMSINPNNPVSLCYCNTGLGGGGCFGNNISNVSILTTPLNNNSGCSTNSNGDSYTQYSPSASTTATINAASSYSMSVTTTANNNISFWIDFDHSGTFDASEFYQVTTSSTANAATILAFYVPASALGGVTGLRVRSHDSFATVLNTDACSNFYEGETEDYVITINPAAPCAGVPNPGTVTATQTLVCSGTGVNMNVSGFTAASGLTFQWQSAPSSTGPWTAVSGATTTAYSTSITANIYYQVIVACGTSTAVTAAVQFSLLPVTACYCNQNLGGSGCSGDNISNVTIIGTPLNNNSTCNSNSTNGTYTQFMPGPTTTATLNLAVTYTISVFTTANNIESVWIDYDHSGTFDVSEHTQICTTSTPNSATTMTFTVPATAQLGLTGMRVRSRAFGNQNGPPDACLTFGSGEAEDYFITIDPATPCAGTPGANSAVASLTTVCPAGSQTLSLATSYTVGGLTYQWYSAPAAAGPYTAITGATTSIYALNNISTSLFYHAVITCTNGPASTTSTPVQIVVSSNPCNCASYCASNATQTVYDEIFNVSIGTLNNTSSCSQTGGPGSVLNEYSNYAGLVAAPSLTAASSYSLNVTVGMCGATFGNSGIVTAFMDFNNNGSFTDPGEAVFTSSYTAFAVAGTTVGGMVLIPATANPGITRMRIVEVESSLAQGSCGTYFAGETEDYCINIAAAAPCAGTPGANSVVATQTNVCPGGSDSFSLATSYTVGGLTYQWLSSPSLAGPYTAISGATLTTYSPTNITVSAYYEAVITCTNGPASTTATPVQVLVGGSPCQCGAYCLTSIPFSTNDDEIFNVSIGTLNNTSTCGQTGGPTSTVSLYSNYAGIIASPNLAAGINYTFNVTVGQCNGNQYSGGVTIYMDFNQNGSFSDPGEQVFVSALTPWAVTGTNVTGIISIPTTATTGTTRMRVIAAEGTTAAGECAGYGYGETEDYCITITPATPCSGAPAANTTVASPTTVCSGGSSTLTLANSYTVGGLTYQWFSAASLTGPYTAIAGATTTAFTATNITASTFYEAVITCTAGPASTTATPVQVAMLANPVYATIPFVENFDNQWQNRCDVDNVPVAANWSDNPTTGNQSWRRQDDGVSANWTSPTSFTCAPQSGAGCANFHTWYALPGTSGDLSVYLNMGTTSTYSLGFYYNNLTGTDSLEVFLSTNGGISFTKQSAYYVASAWTLQTLTFTPNSPTCVVKFTATSDYGASDIGIDSLFIKSACAAPNVTLAASQTTVCNGTPVTLTASGATTYTWNTTATTASISVTPSVSTSYTVTGENTPGCPTTKTINITVKPSPALTVSVAPTASLCPGMSTSLIATSSSGNYTWSPGGQNTAAISVTPAISTVYNVVSTNSLGCSTSSNVTIFVIICTGVSKYAAPDNATFIYPNPNSGSVNVVIENGNGNYTFEIMDITGRIVYVNTLSKAESTLSIKELANGMYTYKITSLTTKTAIKEGKLIKE